jgi:hypothetical protein
MLVRSLFIVSDNASKKSYETRQSFLIARDRTKETVFLQMRKEIHWLRARNRIGEVQKQ